MTQGVITIGREPDNDVVLDYGVVSAHHARIALGDDGSAQIEDLGSTNGTAIGDPHRKIKSARISADDFVYFGSLKVPASRLLSGHTSQGAASSSTLSLRGDSMVLGRDPSADHVLDDPMISWRHARLSRTGAGPSSRTSARPTARSSTAAGSARALQSSRATSSASAASRSSSPPSATCGSATTAATSAIEARDVGITVGGGKKLVAGVSLTVYPSELVG
jgi:hypothetical protein